MEPQETSIANDDDRLLLASFGCVEDAFFWLAGAKSADVHDRIDEQRKKANERKNESTKPLTMVLDTETDGGKGYQLAVQLAFLVVRDQDGSVVKSYESLLRLPKNRRVNWHSYKVHKISDARLARHGVDPKEPLKKFIRWARRVRASGGRIVAHNAAFDRAVVCATLKENGMSVSDVKDATAWFCTMERSKARANCVDRRGRPRGPKNAELYELLHKKPPTWAKLHESALDDCRVTLASYEQGKTKKWW